MAKRTREDLYNLVWPKGGRKLAVDFVSNEDVESAVKLNKDPGSQTAAEAETASPVHHAREARPVRGGLSNYSKPIILEPDPAARCKAPAGTTCLTRVVEREEDEALSALDKYFRKTKAKPMLYYLPLSEEEVLARDRARGRAPPVPTPKEEIKTAAKENGEQTAKAAETEKSKADQPPAPAADGKKPN